MPHQIIMAMAWPGGRIETKPEWMKPETWACRKLIMQAGDDAHWTALLHIHIEDHNLEDWWFDRRDKSFRERERTYWSAEPWERDIFDALGALTEDQRYQAVTGKPCPASCYGEDGCPYTSCPGGGDG